MCIQAAQTDPPIIPYIYIICHLSFLLAYYMLDVSGLCPCVNMRLSLLVRWYLP